MVTIRENRNLQINREELVNQIAKETMGMIYGQLDIYDAEHENDIKEIVNQIAFGNNPQGVVHDLICGGGKTLTIQNTLKHFEKLDKSAIVCVQRVQDAHKIADFLNKYKKNTAFVIEGFSKEVCKAEHESYRIGMCNTDICKEKGCPVRTRFRNAAGVLNGKSGYRIILITHQQLLLFLRETNDIGKIQYWNDKGVEKKRDTLIIDEKIPFFQLNDTFKWDDLTKIIKDLNKARKSKNVADEKGHKKTMDLINEVIKVLENFIEILYTEKRRFRKDIIQITNEEIRHKYPIYFNAIQDLKAISLETIMTLNPLDLNKRLYEAISILSNVRQNPFMVLYDHQEYLNSSIVSFKKNTLEDLPFDNILVFDATLNATKKEYDCTKLEVLQSNFQRDYSHVTFHINKDIHFSKTNIKNKKVRDEQLAREIKEVTEGENALVIIRKSQMEEENKQQEEKALERILLEQNSNLCVQYYGNLKGRNDLQDNTKMILLTEPYYGDERYLGLALALGEQIKQYIGEPYTTQGKGNIRVFQNKFIQQLQREMTLADLIQDCFRCAVRKIDNKEKIDIYLFNKDTEITKELQNFFIGSNVVDWNMQHIPITSRPKSTEREIELLEYLKSKKVGDCITKEKLALELGYKSKVKDKADYSNLNKFLKQKRIKKLLKENLIEGPIKEQGKKVFFKKVE